MSMVTSWLQYGSYHNYALLDLCYQPLGNLANQAGRPVGGSKFLPEAFGSLEPVGGPVVTENNALIISITENS
jgi:hypothetical protein